MLYARTAIHTALRALRAGGLVLAVCVLGVTPGLRGDEVFFTDNPTNGAYDDIVHSLRDVYGNGTVTAGNRNSPSGRWTEQNYGLYQINGTGPQNISMAFL